MLAFLPVAILDPAATAADENPPMPGFRLEASDPRAIEIADDVMAAMGGRRAWDGSRYVSWRFFGRRTHYWDKWTGDVRIEGGGKLILMNIHSKKGRVWEAGTEVTHPDSLAKLLDLGFELWTNDSYWVFMPYKLKDSGVRLRYRGERKMQSSRPADVLELTFAEVGVTPENRYEVLVDKETRLVGEWTFYSEATDEEPRFTMPWNHWRRVGRILLAADHGRGKDWKLAVFDELPRAVFESPDPVMFE
ncbi:MAG: hypothetical protein ACE5G2_05445 [Candidatus Krumholzibacteriia bacterium]